MRGPTCRCWRKSTIPMRGQETTGRRFQNSGRCVNNPHEGSGARDLCGSLRVDPEVNNPVRGQELPDTDALPAGLQPVNNPHEGSRGGSAYPGDSEYAAPTIPMGGSNGITQMHVHLWCSTIGSPGSRT